MADSSPSFTISNATVSNISGAAQDLLSGFANSSADMSKASGAAAEAKNYGLAQGLANENEQYTEESTAIQVMQQNRTNYQSYSGAESDIAGAGLRQSGSALSILRDNASQGALAVGVLQKQGVITEEGYTEQAKSYGILQTAALQQEAADEKAAKEAKEGGILGAIGKVAGAVIGGIGGFALGGPVGAVAGASLGSSVGSAL